MSGCMLCPRHCGADRHGGQWGRCRVSEEICVARIAAHPFEEPPISGTRGSGTVFFAGCSLGCIFCQNKAISRGAAGRVYTKAALGEAILALAAEGVHNINLVTGTHYTDAIAEILHTVKPQLAIPIVWNSSGYERPEALRMLTGLVDIYLPDFKYLSPELSAAYSDAPDYAEHATAALREMVRQTGPVAFDDEGMLKKGTVVRHLVLPGHRADSIALLHHLANTVDVSHIRLSLMRQYTPDFAPPSAPKNLLRPVTTFEYEAVLAEAARLGFEGFAQEKSAASAVFTPSFSE